MADNKSELSLTIKALDQATPTLKSINAKIAALEAPAKLAAAQKKLSGMQSRLGPVMDGFKGVGGAVKNVAGEAFALGGKIAAMAGVAGATLFGIAHSAMEAGDKLAEMADRTGLGIDVFASLGFAAAQADIDQESFNSGMDDFNKKLGQAKAGTGKLLSFLEKVSPALADQVKHAKTSEEAFSLLTDAMSKLEDPQRRSALANAAFANPAFGNFMHQGSAAIQAQQKRFIELSGSQEKFARGAGDLDNVLRESEVAFLGVRNAIGGALFPVMTKLSVAVTDFIVKNREGITKWAEESGAAIAAWIDGGGIDRLVAGLKDVAGTVMSVVDKIGGFKGVAIAVGLVMAGPLLGSVVGLVSALWTLGAALAPLAIAAAPFILAAAPFIFAATGIALAAKAIYDNWGDIKLLFSDLWMGITDAFTAGWAIISPIIDKLGGAMGILQHPFDALMKGNSMIVDAIFGGAGPKLGAEASRPAAAASTTNESRVTVDFNNAPKGTRVSQESSSSQPVDLSMGYSMVTP